MAIQTSTRFTRITLEYQSSVAHLCLQNPPLNIIDITMMEELAEALVEIEAHPDVLVITFAGSGTNFSAGVDVAAHTPDKVEPMLAKFHAVIHLLISSKKVSVAAVHGHCLGGGAELALVCDLVYSSESAIWGFPEIKLGCYPPVAVAALAAVIGQKQAADLILTGRSITGADAADIGLANRALPGEQVESVLQETIEHFKKLSPAALAITKKAMYAWDSIHFDKGLARAEKIYLDDLMRTVDAQEGINAFLQKREPMWKGK
jgi:cyclohexa-1,5-dienecarbonyl-CoA hydratase